MSKNTAPILTILVPTYNRSRYLKVLIPEMSRQIFRMGLQDDILIHIFDNASTDETPSLLRDLVQSHPEIKLTRYEEHLGSAEQNIFRSFKHCETEYVWTLGDDDLPVFDNFPEILNILRSKNHDFLQFNSAVFDADLRETNTGVLQADRPVIEMSMLDFAQYTGFWFVLAGVSAQIFRLKMIQNYDLENIIQSSSLIYSHVTAYLDAYHDKKFAFVNMPLVEYRVVSQDSKHWQSTASRFSVFDEYFWTLGFVRQLKYLERKKIIGSDFLFYTFDTNDFGRFRLIRILVDKIFAQLCVGIESNEKRQKISSAEIAELNDFLIGNSPRFVDLCGIFSQLHRISVSGELTLLRKWKSRKLVSQATAIRRGLAATELFGTVVRTYRGLPIYRIGGTHVCSPLFERGLGPIRMLPGFRSKWVVWGASVDEVIAALEASDNLKSWEPALSDSQFTIEQMDALKAILKWYHRSKLLLKKLLFFVRFKH